MSLSEEEYSRGGVLKRWRGLGPKALKCQSVAILITLPWKDNNFNWEFQEEETQSESRQPKEDIKDVLEAKNEVKEDSGDEQVGFCLLPRSQVNAKLRNMQ